MPDWTSIDNQTAAIAPMLGDVGVGRVLGGRYRLIALMGSGSSARVYLANDLSLGRRVAVKCLRAGLTGDYRFLRRFRAEAKAAAQLGHPNILAVYDWGEDAAATYLVTEVLLGGSLREMIGASPQLSPSQGLLVALQVAQALSYAHELGWVHRDIKPGNLLFGKDGRLRIADFGIARALAEATWTEPEGVLVGTARYAAPEQAAARTVDGKADVYALALTVTEAVTGQMPMVADGALSTMMLRQDRDLDGLDHLGLLGEVLMEAGRADPDRRPRASDLIDRLLRAAQGLPRPGRLPLVEFRLPTTPVGVSLIDLRSARVEPEAPAPTRPPLRRPSLAERVLEATDPGLRRIEGEDLGEDGTIRARPRPVPARLAGRGLDVTAPGLPADREGSPSVRGFGLPAPPPSPSPPTSPTIRLGRPLLGPARVNSVEAIPLEPEPPEPGVAPRSVLGTPGSGGEADVDSTPGADPGERGATKPRRRRLGRRRRGS